jgi:hypothetical protein
MMIPRADRLVAASVAFEAVDMMIDELEMFVYEDARLSAHLFQREELGPHLA